MKKFKVGVIGATGMVGRRFVELLNGHPWFEVAVLAASPRSAGKTYGQALLEKGFNQAMIDRLFGGFARLKDLPVQNAADVDAIADQVDMVFCALNMDKAAIAALETAYAKKEVAVISNNSAHRWNPYVPVIIPEVNPDHSGVIHLQRRQLGVERGFIATKPNCSLQSFVPPLHALSDLIPESVIVATYQAVSGAGRTLSGWPEMTDNVIPLIRGEEEKTENEPLKIWGTVRDSGIVISPLPKISSHCVRVGVSDGHLAVVSVDFHRAPFADDIISRWKSFQPKIEVFDLPSSPQPFLIYHEQDDRPQPKLDRLAGNGMAISLGRLRPDPIFDFKFVCLSHNTIRGAAGGAILMAEMLVKQEFISR